MKRVTSPGVMSLLVFYLLHSHVHFFTCAQGTSATVHDHSGKDANMRRELQVDFAEGRATENSSANGVSTSVYGPNLKTIVPNKRKRRHNSHMLAVRAPVPLTSDNMWKTGQTRLTQTGTLGVSAMQIAVVDDSQLMIIDKMENNVLQVNGHPAWGSIYNFGTRKERPLDLQSNSFCAGGSWLGNGTLINVGGDVGAQLNGIQGVRLFNPCPDNEKCDIYDDPQRVRMVGARWYASVARISDGSVFIMGGMTVGGFINSRAVNNPSIEYYPPKDLHGTNGLPIHSPFLAETLNANLFPIVFFLPDGRIFVAANTKAMIYDYLANTEERLPDIPNGVRITYPMTAGGVLLPLSEKNKYTPEILICGGSKVNDTRAADTMTSQASASDQCVRMILNQKGIKAGWQVERMPQARLMPDLVLLPNGDVLIVNGAKTGVAGYGNVKDQIGQSNADNPALTPLVYRPSAPEGKRFLKNIDMPSSKIARMYHSVATLLPSGEVLIAGSNPNVDRTTAKFPTEYRVETLSPPYMGTMRPTYSSRPDTIAYARTFKLKTNLPDEIPLDRLKVSLIDLGFITHSVHMNSRVVYLKVKSIESGTIEVEGPPSPNIYPPGPGWLYLLKDGIPSVGKKVMVGPGKGPPVDKDAIANVLDKTKTLAKRRPESR